MAGSVIIVDIYGIDELLARYNAGEAKAAIELFTAMQQSVNIVRMDAREYPPESEANRPPPPYYIRGVGTQYADGNRFESERLWSGWTSEIREVAGGVIGEIRNALTTYAPFVHGIVWQMWYHKLRGWRNIAAILDQNLQAIELRFNMAAQRLASFLNGGP